MHIDVPFERKVALEVLFKVTRPDHGLLGGGIGDFEFRLLPLLVAADNEFGDPNMRWFGVELGGKVFTRVRLKPRGDHLDVRAFSIVELLELV